jgi:hypothetical protein
VLDNGIDTLAYGHYSLRKLLISQHVYLLVSRAALLAELATTNSLSGESNPISTNRLWWVRSQSTKPGVAILMDGNSNRTGFKYRRA